VQVVEVGWAVAEPLDDVVDVATVEHDVAGGVGAGAVHRSQRPPLRTVGDSVLASAVEDFAGAVEHDRHDRCFAGHAAHRFGWQWDPVGGFAHRVVVQSVAQCEPVDVDTDLGHPPLAGSFPGHGGHDGVGQQHVDRGPGVAVGLFDGGQLGVDRRPQFGVAFGIE
jgi:hypothetical protein